MLESSKQASSFHERSLVTEVGKLFLLNYGTVDVFCSGFMEALEARSPAATKGWLLHRYGGSGRVSSSHELEAPEVR
jgi:hypothetical protein